jgi:hypothetical protein
MLVFNNHFNDMDYIDSVTIMVIDKELEKKGYVPESIVYNGKMNINGEISINLDIDASKDYRLEIYGHRLLEENKFFYDKNDPDNWDYRVFNHYPSGDLEKFLVEK